MAGSELTLFSGILAGILPSLSIDHDHLHLFANEEWPVHLNTLVCFLQYFEHLPLEVLVLVIDFFVFIFFHNSSFSNQFVKVLDRLIVDCTLFLGLVIVVLKWIAMFDHKLNLKL